MKTVARLGWWLLLFPACATAAWLRPAGEVTVYAGPDLALPLATVPAGGEVQLIARQDGVARVRLADGREAWVAEAAVSDAPPPAVRLAESERERAALRARLEELEERAAAADRLAARLRRAEAELAELRRASGTRAAAAAEDRLAAEQALAAAQAETARLQAALEDLETRHAAAEAERARLREALASAQAQQAGPALLRRLAWLAVFMSLSFLAGGVLGYRLLAARVRRRFLGIKVW